MTQSNGETDVRGNAHYQLIALGCQADRIRLTVDCAVPETRARTGGGTTPATDLIYGGQNLYVKLTSSGAAYNSGTGQFTFTTTVQNLIDQAIGTTDGVSLSPNGVRVYFASGPTVTGGTGTASVVPDGFATFTAAGQPYYQYNEILSSNEVSAGKVWTLIMPPTVTTFSFILYVSAPMQYEHGYVEINGMLPGGAYGALHPGSTTSLAGVAKDALGNTRPGAVISWGTADPSMATVDGSGVVTGVRAGNVVITASSGGTTGNILVGVTGTTRSWNGSVSTDWETGGNWTGGYTPALVDTASIPFGVPNQPTLTSPVSIGGLIVADNAAVTLGGLNMTLSKDALTGLTGGGVVGSGSLILSGTGATFGGRFPNTSLTGTYSLSSDVIVTAPINVTGTLTTSTYTTQVRSQ